MDREKIPNYNQTDEAMERQSSYDPQTKVFTARCAVCGKAYTLKKRWFRSLYDTRDKLKRNFNFDSHCQRWVCGDCYYIYTSAPDEDGMCRECAEARGFTGQTNAEWNAAFDLRERERRKKR